MRFFINRWKTILCFITTVAVLFLGCSSNESAGTVTDTGNTVAFTGTVYRADGQVASDAVVRMARIVDVDSVEIPDLVEVQTDASGMFAFDSVIADTFQLAIIDSVVEEIFYLPRASRFEKSLDSITLEKAVVINSILYYEDVSDLEIAVGSHFMVYLVGTPFYQSVFANDSFKILIPPGDWWIEFFPGDPQIIAKLQSSGVEDSSIYRSWKLPSDVESGDSLDLGPFIWGIGVEVDSLIKESEEAAKNVSRLYGEVVCREGAPCENVEVTLITDLYAFDFEDDSLEFVSMTTTDSLGRWWLSLPKEVPEDSFRVEFRKVEEGVVEQVGTSRYVKASEIEDLSDTLDLGSVTLAQPSVLVSGVVLVVNSEDTTQSSNCMVNSVVVGIKGTSHFVRDVTCNMLTLSDLPPGEQEIVLYSGDPKVVSVLQESDTPMNEYVTFVDVSLSENATQQQQWLTYTPPSQNNFE